MFLCIFFYLFMYLICVKVTLKFVMWFGDGLGCYFDLGFGTWGEKFFC